MPGVDCKPTQLVVFCILCWCCLWSVFPTSEADIPPTLPLYSPPCPPASPASSCHTQLFHSSISPAHHCSVLSLRSSRLSPPRTSHCFYFLSALLDLSLSACSFSVLLYLSPPHTYFLSLFLPLSLSATLFVISPINVQFPSCLSLGGNEQFLHEMWNLNLCKTWVMTGCSLTQMDTHAHTQRQTFSPIKLVVKTLTFSAPIFRD